MEASASNFILDSSAGLYKSLLVLINRKSILITPAILFLFLCQNQSAEADTWSSLGYGAKNQSMANSTMSLPTDAYSQSYNPSLMAFQPKVLASFGMEGSIAKFENISGVIVDTPSLSGTSNYTTGSVDTQVPDSFLYTIGIQAPLSKKAEDPLHLGIIVSSPVAKVLGIDTQDAYQPQYAMYLNDTQRLHFETNLAKALSENLALGLGAQIYYIQGTTSTARLPTGAGNNSTARLRADVKPAVAPTAGLTYTAGETKNLSLGFVYRGKQDSRSQVDFSNIIGLGFGSNPFVLTATNSLYFDPETFMLGASYLSGKNKFSASTHFERWSDFSGTTMVLTFTTFKDTFHQTLADTKYHDVFTWHAGYEHGISEDLAIRLGYAYIPSPVPDQNGESNVLDSDKHEGFIGAGYKWQSDLTDGPLHIDACAFLHYLTPKTVTKVSGLSVGAPGYKIGGTVFGYGITMTAEY